MYKRPHRNLSIFIINRFNLFGGKAKYNRNDSKKKKKTTENRESEKSKKKTPKITIDGCVSNTEHGHISNLVNQIKFSVVFVDLPINLKKHGNSWLS